MHMPYCHSGLFCFSVSWVPLLVSVWCGELLGLLRPCQNHAVVLSSMSAMAEFSMTIRRLKACIRIMTSAATTVCQTASYIHTLPRNRRSLLCAWSTSVAVDKRFGLCALTLARAGKGTTNAVQMVCPMLVAPVGACGTTAKLKGQEGVVCGWVVSVRLPVHKAVGCWANTLNWHLSAAGACPWCLSHY
jgi:hypothetical protein